MPLWPGWRDLIAPWWWKWTWNRWKEDVPRKVAWLLPRAVARWAAIRVAVHATTGEHETQVVPDLLFMDALKRWG